MHNDPYSIYNLNLKLPLAYGTRGQQEVSLERSSAQWHAEEGPPPTKNRKLRS